MSRRSKQAEDAALAEEAERLQARGIVPDEPDPAVLESATMSEAVATVATVPEAPAEAPVVEEPPPPPVWTPSESAVPPAWVVAAKREVWKVHAGDAEKAFGGKLLTEGETARWTGGDVDYRYFRGGKVLATFRTGDVFGVLRTDPVAEFDVEPVAPEVVG